MDWKWRPEVSSLQGLVFNSMDRGSHWHWSTPALDALEQWSTPALDVLEHSNRNNNGHMHYHLLAWVNEEDIIFFCPTVYILYSILAHTVNIWNLLKHPSHNKIICHKKTVNTMSSMMSPQNEWVQSLRSIQKSGAFQRVQMCPTEECSKNSAQFLVVLLSWICL